MPLSHLYKDRVSTPGDADQRWDLADYFFLRPTEWREITLQPLSTKLLRELIGAAVLSDPKKPDAPAIKWDLKIDHITNDVEAKLLAFENLVQEWGRLLGDSKESLSLKGQLAKVKMVMEVENQFQDFSDANIRMFGGSYLHWHYNLFDDGCWFHSRRRGVIAIKSKKVTRSTTRIDPGDEPPPSFENINLPPGVNGVHVNFDKVYERSGETMACNDDRSES